MRSCVRVRARAYLRVCTLREHRMRVAHTCRLPPSGALLSSIYLKCDSVVKCADRCSADAACIALLPLKRQCTRSAHGAMKAWPMDGARRRLTRRLAPRLPALGGFTVVPLVPGRARVASVAPLVLQWARRRVQTGSFHWLRVHADTRTRTGSCTSATAARIRSAHVDSTSAVRASCSELGRDFHLPLLRLSLCSLDSVRNFLSAF